MNLENKIDYKIIFICWAIAVISTLGSLFFSEVMEFSPCALCWYQRIAMYPLVLILGVGLFQPVKSVIHYSLPILVIGWFISLYHNLLHYGIVPESASPCRSGVPCSTVYINWFGFITIPMLSFIAFSIIIGLLVLLNRRVTNEK
jgi:disulfide bond formation protein DsbB